MKEVYSRPKKAFENFFFLNLSLSIYLRIWGLGITDDWNVSFHVALHVGKVSLRVDSDDGYHSAPAQSALNM